MSGFEGFPGSAVRARLDHPVIDADAHVVECEFAHLDFVRQLAGHDAAERIRTFVAGHGPTVRGFWWGVPSGAHTGDRAMAQLPRYFRSRMDELGIDIQVLHNTFWIEQITTRPEVETALCWSWNRWLADVSLGIEKISTQTELATIKEFSQVPIAQGQQSPK